MTPLWRLDTGESISSSPAIGPGGTIYIGSNSDHLYAISPDGRLKWSFKTEGDVVSSPAVTRNGVIVVGGGNTVYAVNDDGTLRWKSETGELVHGSAAIGADGMIYIGSVDGYFYAFGANGEVKWKGQTGKVISSAGIGENGTIYIITMHHQLYAFEPNGNQKWVQRPVKIAAASPAIGSAGRLYLGMPPQVVGRDGTYFWRARGPQFGCGSSAALDGKGRFLIGSPTGLMAVNMRAIEPPKGFDLRLMSLERESELPKQGQSITIVARIGGKLHFRMFDKTGEMILDVRETDIANRERELEILRSRLRYAWDGEELSLHRKGNIIRGIISVTGSSPEDQTRWTAGGRQGGFPFGSSPAVRADGSVLIGSRDGKLYAISPRGKVLSEVNLGPEPVASSPTVASDGTIYIGSGCGVVYALEGDVPLADSSWPKFRGDLANTGRVAETK